jgi:hypothetical protein
VAVILGPQGAALAPYSPARIQYKNKPRILGEVNTHVDALNEELGSMDVEMYALA